jgi:hypothetical protein
MSMREYMCECLADEHGHTICINTCRELSTVLRIEILEAKGVLNQ